MSETGMLAKSKAGHDKDKLYVIIRTGPSYVYLADGKIRTINKPKKKKRKHIQLIKEEYDVKNLDDVKIRRILDEWDEKKNREETKQED